MEKAKKQGSALVESGFDGLRVKPLHFLSVYTDRIWRSFGRSLHESDANLTLDRFPEITFLPIYPVQDIGIGFVV